MDEPPRKLLLPPRGENMFRILHFYLYNKNNLCSLLLLTYLNIPEKGKEGNVFNDAQITFYFTVIWRLTSGQVRVFNVHIQSKLL